jgi:mRNA interferase MazF
VPPRRGEVWLFDYGMVAKVRPVLVLSVPFTDTDRALATVVFHTTTLRGSQFEVKIQVPFLKEGAFVAQSIATYPIARAIRELGALNAVQLKSKPPYSSDSANLYESLSSASAPSFLRRLYSLD